MGVRVPPPAPGAPCSSARAPSDHSSLERNLRSIPAPCTWNPWTGSPPSGCGLSGMYTQTRTCNRNGACAGGCVGSSSQRVSYSNPPCPTACTQADCTAGYELVGGTKPNCRCRQVPTPPPPPCTERPRCTTSWSNGHPSSLCRGQITAKTIACTKCGKPVGTPRSETHSGTKNGTNSCGTWSPTASTNCSGVCFTQTASCRNSCSGAYTGRRTATGTKQTQNGWSAWSVEPERLANGSCIQTRTCRSGGCFVCNGRATRTATCRTSRTCSCSESSVGRYTCRWSDGVVGYRYTYIPSGCSRA